MSNSRIRSASPPAIAAAARHLAQGDLVGIPTETVYGLAADATNPDAVRKIFAAKGRPPNNPLIIHVDSAESALRWVKVDEPEWLARQWQIAIGFWPGPLTVVVPRAVGVVDEVTAGSDTVAVRVPSHPVMRSLLAHCDFPIAAPSANPSNYVSPTCAAHVQAGLGDKVALILDGGDCECGLESTIIRLVHDGVELLRPGGISSEQLQSAFGCVTAVQVASSNGDVIAMPAPGMMAKHYSPSKPLCKINDWRPDQDPAPRVARITFAPIDPDDAQRFGWYRCLSPSGDLHEVAQQLFTAIRDADDCDCDRIVIDQCDRTGIGRAIMDRIDRAAY